ncbi:MAG: stage II sporulation protein P [Clostridia bacterium]|nr:MAG: stage II sporulation protein P [Clostridia bacterium]
MTKSKTFWLVLASLALVVGLTFWQANLEVRPAEVASGDLLYGEERTDGYFTIRDTNGRILDMTARVVYPGDEFIAEDNRHYRINRIEGDTAWTELLGVETLSGDSAQPVTAGGGARNLVAIYNTHSDESYTPTDGSDSIPAGGGIYKVGEVMAERLRSLGVQVEYDKRPHEPHDAEAYRRSRRTAVKMAQDAPAAILDIHRDGVPQASFYDARIAGEDVTRVRLVVGRQNANMGANLDFAKRLKAYLDEKYPGLVRGIFIGRGDYNQDISPRSVLVEVGTYTNGRDQAQRGGALFVEGLPPVLGIGTAASPQGPGPVGPGAPPSTRGDWRGVLWVIVALVAGGIAFLVISTGSWQGAMERLRRFTTREWGLGWPRPQRKRDDPRR